VEVIRLYDGVRENEMEHHPYNNTQMVRQRSARSYEATVSSSPERRTGTPRVCPRLATRE